MLKFYRSAAFIAFSRGSLAAFAGVGAEILTEGWPTLLRVSFFFIAALLTVRAIDAEL